MRVLDKKRLRAITPKRLLTLTVILVLIGFIWWILDGWSKNNSSPDTDSQSTSSAQTKLPNLVPFNKQQRSVNDPGSLWVVVNKGRILPIDFAPSQVLPNVSLHYDASANDSHLQPDAAQALETMTSVAKKDGILLKLFSGYRSYSQQRSVYSNFVASQGQAYADVTSARPGHSEHQTGLAADVAATSGECDIEICFGDMAEGKWVAANSYKYGFILRYPKDKQNLTGYEYEPWHLRFVGIDLASQLYKTGETLEQFFNLPTYADYPAQPYKLKL
ncbi:M15 family metallopeptidase [Candidatus Saccharibacteria bacterium]|nr:M15 family metallopeptidase [Candidatus Saccharibacteria bacterium]